MCLQPSWYDLSLQDKNPADPEATSGAAAAPSADAAVSTREPAPSAAVDTASQQEPAQRRNLSESCEEGAWTVASCDGLRHPHGRYEHDVAGMGMKMFVVGGNCGEPSGNFVSMVVSLLPASTCCCAVGVAASVYR